MTDLKFEAKLNACGGLKLMLVEEPERLVSSTFASVVWMAVQFSPLGPQMPGWIRISRTRAAAGIPLCYISRWERTSGLQIAIQVRVSD